MRVLHVARFVHPHVGGTETFIAGLVDALAAEGVESRLLTADRYRTAAGPAPHAGVTAVPVVGPDRFPKPIGGFGRIGRAIAGADVVHVHDIRFLFETAFAVCRLQDKPLVLSTHGLIFHTEEFSLAKTILWRAWYARALRRLDRVIAVSRHDEEFCVRNGISANLTLLPNPVPVERFLDVRREPLADGGPLLYFGRISSGKGVDRLAAALRAADGGVRLDVVGTGDEASMREARRAFAGLEDRVAWRGPAPDETLREELGRCRCVVMPSRNEAFGLAMIEALAAGVPVVASDLPALREIAPPRGVALVDFDDPVAVVEAIHRVGDGHDPAAAKAWARRFSWDGRAAGFLDIYRTSIAAHNRPQRGI